MDGLRGNGVLRVESFGYCTHKAHPVLLRDDAVYELHLSEDGAFPALAGPQEQQLDLLLLRLVVLRFVFGEGGRPSRRILLR